MSFRKSSADDKIRTNTIIAYSTFIPH